MFFRELPPNIINGDELSFGDFSHDLIDLDRCRDNASALSPSLAHLLRNLNDLWQVLAVVQLLPPRFFGFRIHSHANLM